jgi:hypothetical protein
VPSETGRLICLRRHPPRHWNTEYNITHQVVYPGAAGVVEYLPGGFYPKQQTATCQLDPLIPEYYEVRRTSHRLRAPSQYSSFAPTTSHIRLPQNKMDRYWYQPLPPIQEMGRTPPFTRLMTLAAGNAADPLRCSLAIINVEDPPRYEALSYVWGKNTSESRLWCDGRPLTITPNLDRALRSLRLPTLARRLWVDAICIDQQNVEERTRQVQYMRLIYKHATQSIVWLGPKTTGVEQAFDLAWSLSRIRDQHSHDAPLRDALVASTLDANQSAMD